LVDFAACVGLAAFKPPTDFCRRVLVYGTAVSKQAALKVEIVEDKIVEDKIVEDKIVEERKRYGKQSDKRG
jgi:hypothetical protein